VFLLVSAVFMLFGCSPYIYQQTIPVSTNPIGAKIYADGTYMGVTPTTISLERRRDHILTLMKENYQQRDVVVRRVYQREKTLLKAVNEGMDAGRFFKNRQMGISRGMSSMQTQEQSGEAYILSPSSVAVMLTPLGQPPGAAEYIDSEYGRQYPQPDEGPSAGDLARVGAGVAATQIKPVEKKWSKSSSTSSTYSSPDGRTTVTKTKSTKTSVGVGFDPSGLIDILFK